MQMVNKIATILTAGLLAAVPVLGEASLQINVYSDSNCNNYVTSFENSGVNLNYGWKYGGIYSFRIVDCFTDVEGGGFCEAHAYENGNQVGSVRNNIGTSACAGISGGSTTSWKLYAEDFDDSDSG
jgi:hypothetical protein